MKISRDLLAAIVATVAFCIVVGLGFWKSRGPATQRLIRADEGRIRAIGQLAGQINFRYTQRNKQLPDALTEEEKRTSRDPLSKKPLEYTLKSPTQFSLCADFMTNSPADYNEGAYDFWRHDAGRKCFDFEAGGQAPATPYFYY